MDMRDYLELLARCNDLRASEAQLIKVESIVDYFGEDKAFAIKHAIRPKMHECYRNATLMALNLECEYCEGLIGGLVPVDHAFVCYEGHYFDPTAEFVLGEDVRTKEYAIFRKWDYKEALDKMQGKGTYGGLIDDYVREKIDNEKEAC